ncbi:multicopper oxidase [Intrasporangium oryzae NRRL B-24470]|uniref:Multicopper oxidase n=1 Tax=Intrasporangium oryzae NRRL B-24470 TaxID=1386089 RepID=W9GB86_9MICO|nr:multicopper oxidase [Intrasporangium oryzae NRRL B-24470]
MLRDAPAVVWLVATGLVALARPVLHAPTWLLIHLLLLGAVSHSVLVWSAHFADALLHTPHSQGDLRARSSRLVLLNAGVLCVLVGVLAEWWPLTLVGATSVAAAAAWHGAALFRQLRAALPARFAVTVRYYVCAALMLPLGATFGTILARIEEDSAPNLVVAHVTVNVFGWLGLTVLGTLLTFWPTMLRTRIPGGAERAAARALPVVVGGLVITVTAALVGWLTVAALGLVVYLAGLAMLAVPFVAAARQRPPRSFATRSVLSGLVWLVAVIVLLTIALLTSPTWEKAEDLLSAASPALAVGFGAQLLVGALSYLMPVALRGGPHVVRATTRAIERGGLLRLALTNVGLPLALLPWPEPVRTVGGALVLVGLGSFLPLMVSAVRVSVRARADRASRGAALSEREVPKREVPERARREG